MEEPIPIPNPARVMPLRNEFHEEGYLYLYPDIARGVSSGAIQSGWQHFFRYGFVEGRQWISKADPLIGVSRDISLNDEMFTGNEIHYFDVGESALHCIEIGLSAARRSKSTVRKVLDLPCGHGRVMRFLKKAFPDAELTACDLNGDGVEYCAKRFGAVPVRSHENIDEISIARDFDLIWCGSLLTHFSEKKCTEFIRLFQRALRPGGILIFTTHGRGCADGIVSGRNRHSLDDQLIENLLRDYHRTDFGYVNYSFQSGYGFSLIHPSFVVRNLLHHPEWQILSYHESAWDKLQDVVCAQKSFLSEKT